MRTRNSAIVYVVKCMLNKSGAITKVELLFDVLAVGLDSAIAHTQFFRNLPPASAFAQETKDLQFAVGQAIDGSARPEFSARQLLQ